VARHAHHRAFAVGHQHVIADPHRHRLPGERVGDGDPGRHALLLDRRQIGFHHAAALAFLDEGGELRVTAGGKRGERVLRRQRDEGHAHDGVGAGRKHPQFSLLAVELVGEREAHPVALPDPVGLHGLDPLGPAGKRIERGEKFLGVARDRHVVHRDLALLHHGAGAPAASVYHLLVGEHGAVDRVPVHDAGLLVDESFLEHLQEQPLIPAVVGGLAGRELARPVDGEAERFQLALHVSDVLVGPSRRRHAVRHRRVLGGEAERVPAHRLQDVPALHPVVAGEDVADGVVAHVPHVELAGGVGEHREAVVLGLAGRFARAERAARVPVLLGLALDGVRIVFLLHGQA
jgi:hypothetical protein